MFLTPTLFLCREKEQVTLENSNLKKQIHQQGQALMLMGKKLQESEAGETPKPTEEQLMEVRESLRLEWEPKVE